jgi:hypothetical protein
MGVKYYLTVEAETRRWERGDGFNEVVDGEKFMVEGAKLTEKGEKSSAISSSPFMFSSFEKMKRKRINERKSARY